VVQSYESFRGAPPYPRPRVLFRGVETSAASGAPRAEDEDSTFAFDSTSTSEGKPSETE